MTICKNSFSYLFRFVRFNSDFTVNIVFPIRVSIRKTFAQFLRKETQNFSFFEHRFCLKKKNNNLHNHSQKSFRAKLPYSAFAKLKFWRNSTTRVLRKSAVPQFRVRIQFWKNLVLECLPIGNFYIIDQLMTVKKSSNLTIFSTILVLDMLIS